MLKNYNKLTILSVVLLVCAILILAVGFSFFGKILDKIIYNYDSLTKIKYTNVLADFLIIIFFLSLLASIVVGIISLFKIRKTKEKGEIVAVFSTAISALWFLGSLYAGWGLW